MVEHILSPILFVDIGQHPFLGLHKAFESHFAQLGNQYIRCRLKGSYLETVFYVYVVGIGQCYWFMAYGLWFMVYGLWFMVCGLWLKIKKLNFKPINFLSLNLSLKFLLWATPSAGLWQPKGLGALGYPINYGNKVIGD